MQFITAHRVPNGPKLILWRHGDYQYQIEISDGTKISFDAEYYEALNLYSKHLQEQHVMVAC